MEWTIKGVIEPFWLTQETPKKTETRIHIVIEAETSNFRCQIWLVFRSDNEWKSLMPGSGGQASLKGNTILPVLTFLEFACNSEQIPVNHADLLNKNSFLFSL